MSDAAPQTPAADHRPIARWRDIRFAPITLLGALILHGAVAWVLLNTFMPERKEETYQVTQLGLLGSDPADALALDDLLAPPPQFDLDAPPEPELDRVVEDSPVLASTDEPPTSDTALEAPGNGGPGPPDEPGVAGVIGLGPGTRGGGGGGGGRGGGRRSGLASPEIPLVVVGLGGAEFKEFVDDLRQRGLDLVFVVDATASMDKFIAQARATIDDIIADVSAVVSDLRLGVIAYRDRDDGALTSSVPLTDDRYRIHNFLADLHASGGGDFEEAVEEGLRVAVEDQPWRDGARRVLVLVGDAPPHEKDEAKALATVRAFAREPHSVLSVLYTGARPGSEPTERDRNTQRVLERLAHVANGMLTNLQAGEDDLCGLILDAAFGVKWHDDIRKLLERPRDDWRRRIVKDKVAHGQRDWLAKNLAREPVYPVVVEGCLELFDARVAQQALDLVKNESAPAAVRSAGLFLLKRKAAPDVVLDVARPLADQAPQVAALQRAVVRYADSKPAPLIPQPPGGAAGGTAPPRPPAGKPGGTTPPQPPPGGTTPPQPKAGGAAPAEPKPGGATPPQPPPGAPGGSAPPSPGPSPEPGQSPQFRIASSSASSAAPRS